MICADINYLCFTVLGFEPWEQEQTPISVLTQNLPKVRR